MASPLQIAPGWSITYGSLTVGGSDANFLGPVEDTLAVFQSRRSARVVFDFIVYSTSGATFLSKQQDALSQFRTPRAQLTIDAPSGLEDYIPTAGASGNVGFDAEPTIVMVPDPLNCDVFQRYRATIDVSLPETLSGQGGRRDNMEMESFEPNRRRTVTISGTYTALTSNNARAQYEDQIATYATAALAKVESDSSVKWQLVDENQRVNDTDKMLEFSRTYREITLAQNASADEDSTIVIQEFEMTEVTPGSRDTYIGGAKVQPFQEFNVSCTVVCDVTVTDDSALRAFWISTVRPRLISLASSRLAKGPTSGTTAIENEFYSPGLEANTITGGFRYISRNGSGLIAAMLTKIVRENTGLQLTNITTGRPHEKSIDEGPPLREFTMRIMEERVKGGAFFDPRPPKDFWEKDRSDQRRQITRGQGASTITTVIRDLMVLYEYAIEYVGGVGGVTQGTRSNPAAFVPSNLTGNDGELNQRPKQISNS